MITKKICLIGAFSVGKTSLVERFVHSIFSDKYLSTVGVKISKKTVTVQETEMNLVLWDLEGKDDYSEVPMSYVRGAMGVFLVADGMRRETLDIAMDLSKSVVERAGDIPQILLINKVDLAPTWEISEPDIAAAEEAGFTVFRTSAKSGQAVDEAFSVLAERMLAR